MTIPDNANLNLNPQKLALLETITGLLSGIPGVAAVVLGGSTARGLHRPDSDLDIGIYYHQDAPFAIDEIRRAAAAISSQGAPDVTDFYGWGAWVNGGAWITTAHGKVDFLYRSIEQVQRTIDEALRGETRHDFDQQPAFGFYSVIYLSETRICRPLWDPRGEIARLKAQVQPYPPLLKSKLVASSLWLAEFTLLHADGYAQKGDVYASAGALTRAAAYLTQALFALNETYFTGDKTALSEIAGFALQPPRYGARLSAALGQIGMQPAELAQSTARVRGLWQEVVALTGGSYAPAFQVPGH